MTVTTEREMLWTERSNWVHLCQIERTGEKTGALSITLLGYGETSIDHLIHEQEVSVSRADPDEDQIAKWRRLCEEILDNPDTWSCGIHG